MKGILIVLIFGGIALLGLGAFLIQSDLAQQREQQESGNWPTAPARIVSSERVDSDGSGDYAPEVTYSFEVDGQTFSGRRIAFFSGLDVDNTLARYPAGSEVPVYYNPVDPSRAVLDREHVGDLGLGAGLGAIMILLGVGGIIGGLLAWVIARLRARRAVAA